MAGDARRGDEAPHSGPAIARRETRSLLQRQPTTAGGVAPTVWKLTRGRLPSGIRLAPTLGRFTGTPSEAGTHVVAVEASDGLNAKSTSTYAIVITAPPTRLQHQRLERAQARAGDPRGRRGVHQRAPCDRRRGQPPARGDSAVGRGTAGTDAGERRTAAPGAMRLRSADAVEDGWGHVTVPNQQYLGVVGDETPGLLLRA